ncbi:MAG: hypothetical protein ABIH35_03085 [Patescibacteria group bacterium]
MRKAPFVLLYTGRARLKKDDSFQGSGAEAWEKVDVQGSQYAS